MKVKQKKNSIYEVDQSGKVEQTNQDTVVAFANSQNQFGLLLKASVKRKLQYEFRKNRLYKKFPYIIFGLLVLIGIEKSRIKGSIVIDTEYVGHEDYILKLLYSSNYTYLIKFGFVGKSSLADHYASKISHKKIKADYVVTYDDIKQKIETCLSLD